jgi:hypothetical protein
MPPPRPPSRPSSAGPISRERDRLIAWLLAATAAGVFLPALACGFFNIDDPMYVLQNPLVLGGLSAAGVRGGGTGSVSLSVAPTSTASSSTSSSATAGLASPNAPLGQLGDHLIPHHRHLRPLASPLDGH